MNIVVTEPQVMAQAARAALEGLGEVRWGPFTDAELEDGLPDCDVLMVRLGRYIGRPHIARAAHLRFIVTATTGLDHIDLDAAKAAGVRVVSLRDCPQAIQDVSATAEHTMGLALALLRHTPKAVAHVLSGGWNRNEFWGTQLRAKRFGIIGHGRIGGMVARYADAFGMEVAAYDVRPEKIGLPAKSAGLDDLLRMSDVVSLHLTASEENRHFLGDAALRRMKPGAILVNTARGSIMDEAAVADAVSSGRLSGVAVDVLDGEETGSVAASPLLASARSGHNVLITPHVGGATTEFIAQAEGAVIQHLAALLEPRP